MLSAELVVLANSVIKTAGLGETFDTQDRTHIEHLQNFAKKAQETCVENWHRASHVQKIASRENVREAYGTLAALTKWAEVAEKTASLSPAAHAAIYRHAMDNDELSRDIFRRHLNESLPAVAVTAGAAGTAGGLLAHSLARNPYVAVPVGLATGLAAGGVGSVLAAGQARQNVLDSYLTRIALTRSQAQLAQQGQKAASNLPLHLIEPLFRHAMEHDAASRAAYADYHRDAAPFAIAGAAAGGAAVGVPLYYAKAKPLTYLGGAALGTAAGGYLAKTEVERGAKNHVIDALLERARQSAPVPTAAPNAQLR